MQFEVFILLLIVVLAAVGILWRVFVSFIDDGPVGEVPYELMRQGHCICAQYNGPDKYYRPMPSYVDGRFIARNMYDSDDFIYLD